MIIRSASLTCLLLLAPIRPATTAALALSDQAEVLEKAADLIAARYVFPEAGEKLAKQLRADARAQLFGHAADPKAFANAVTERLRALSGDGHLGLEYSATVLPDDKAAAEKDYTAAELERWYGAHVNHGFARIEQLEGNIGYLDLRVFAPPGMAGDVAAAAMTVLAQSDALIIDLRHNGGGFGEMEALLASYLFDSAPRPLSGTYDRPSGKLTPVTTLAWVPGRRLGARKPVYILTSHRTFSAAEAFAYDLQALKRATVVGEPTGGGAHPFEYRRVHPHFVLSLAEMRSVNPITGANWQGSGVKPDLAVPAAEALDAAMRLAELAVKPVTGSKQVERN